MNIKRGSDSNTNLMNYNLIQPKEEKYKQNNMMQMLLYKE